MRTALAVVLVLAAAAGCGGGDDSGDATVPSTGVSSEASPRPGQDPEDFFADLFGFYFDGRYGRAWELLHPGHRAVVPRSRFVDCVGDTLGGTSIELEDVEVLEVHEEPIDVPEIPETSATAVTVRLTVTNVFGTEERNTTRYRLVDVGGRWAWILEPEDLAAYRRGACPT